LFVLTESVRFDAVWEELPRITVPYGYTNDYFDTYTTKVRALKASDLDAIAKKVLVPDRMVWVVVGDRAKIEAGIKALNWGPVKYLDADGNPI
jgi:zinc protease